MQVDNSGWNISTLDFYSLKNCFYFFVMLKNNKINGWFRPLRLCNSQRMSEWKSGTMSLYPS